MYKKIIITFLLVFSAFLVSNKVSAREISQFCEYTEPCLSTEDIDTIIKNNNIDTSIYDGYFISIEHDSRENYYFLSFSFFKKEYDFKWSPLPGNSSNVYNNSGELLYRGYLSDYYSVDISDINNLILTDAVSFGGDYRRVNAYYSNVDLLDSSGNIVFPANDLSSDEEFTITIMDTEFDYKYGVNYVKGEQDNTIEYYLQDSGILIDTHAKGYEIDKIYYDEALTKEAFLDDALEVDTTLYVTWKSKINITSEIKKDSSSNDVISITYDFSKIYNENYTYWISNDGENYVDITSQLNEEKKYISDVYFFGKYYARVQDEAGNTISVNHIRIKYYYISINTEVGTDTDDDGNVIPYIILDYSAYKNIKDNLIFEYSIDNGKTWVNVTNRLDSNFKYKLYVKIGDKVKTRVRTNGSTVLPGTSTGSDYVIDEDFINSLLTNDNFEFTLNKLLKPIKFIISSITEFYNDFCPPIVQNFLYLSFIILIVLFIIKLIW